MGISGSGKIKTLLTKWPSNAVVTSARLKELGITPQHVQKYVTGGWLEKVAPGVLKRPDETLSWQGCLHSLQMQTKLEVHVGAISALEMEGYNHYIRFGQEKVYLFSLPGVALPKWFREYPWPVEIEHIQTKLIPHDFAPRWRTAGNFNLRCSSPEQAILEVLHLAPQRFDLVEAYKIAESLRTLRPLIMQAMLEFCNSIKVIRLFLYFAEKANLPVLKHMDLSRLNLGTGDRALVKDGAYVAQYRLVLPKELVTHDD